MANSYELPSPDEFDSIPDEILERCLGEYVAYIKGYRLSKKLLPEGSKLKHKKLVWVDDGKQDLTVNFTITVSGGGDAKRG